MNDLEVDERQHDAIVQRPEFVRNVNNERLIAGVRHQATQSSQVQLHMKSTDKFGRYRKQKQNHFIAVNVSVMGALILVSQHSF